MRISVLSLVPISVASVAVLFALSACGGGGGGGGTPGGGTQTLRSAVQALALWSPPPIIKILQAENLSDTCPRTFPLPDLSGFVYDFGAGCTSPILGEVAGRVISQPIEEGRTIYTFENFRIRGILLNGTWQIRYNDVPPTVESGDVRYTDGSCEVRVVISEALRYREESHVSYQITGTITTRGGSFNFTANPRFSDTCDAWSDSGSLIVAGGAAHIDYLSCGTARFTIGGQTETVNLNNLRDTYNPCN